MARVFKLKAVRLHDLVQVIGSLSPQEVAKVKPEDAVKSSVRIEKIFKELEDANQEYSAVAEKLVKAVEPQQTKFKEDLAAVKSQGLTPEEVQKKGMELADAANAEIAVILEAKRKEVGAEEAEEKEVSVKISSDERFNLLKEIFEKVAPEKFLKRGAMVEVYEALEAAKEE